MAFGDRVQNLTLYFESLCPCNDILFKNPMALRQGLFHSLFGHYAAATAQRHDPDHPPIHAGVNGIDQRDTDRSARCDCHSSAIHTEHIPVMIDTNDQRCDQSERITTASNSMPTFMLDGLNRSAAQTVASRIHDPIWTVRSLHGRLFIEWGIWLRRESGASC
jgi:hypothetical protein